MWINFVWFKIYCNRCIVNSWDATCPNPFIHTVSWNQIKTFGLLYSRNPRKWSVLFDLPFHNECQPLHTFASQQLMSRCQFLTCTSVLLTWKIKIWFTNSSSTTNMFWSVQVALRNFFVMFSSILLLFLNNVV